MLVATAQLTADRLVCRCLQVRESQVRDCIVGLGLETVPDIKSHCGAGGGCNACHRRIRDLIAAHRSQSDLMLGGSRLPLNARIA